MWTTGTWQRDFEQAPAADPGSIPATPMAFFVSIQNDAFHKASEYLSGSKGIFEKAYLLL